MYTCMGSAKYIFTNIWIKRGVIMNTLLINEGISSLVVPPKVWFSCLPAQMEHSSSLTVDEWMLWVNCYSLYCVYLPHGHLECWRHIVLASRLLFKHQLNKDEVRIANALLLQFCCWFEVRYGPEAVTPNIHLYAHLSDCIEDFGPMSNFVSFALNVWMVFLVMNQLTADQ